VFAHALETQVFRRLTKLPEISLLSSLCDPKLIIMDEFDNRSHDMYNHIEVFNRGCDVKTTNGIILTKDMFIGSMNCAKR
jgi:hypothetical protein